MYMHQRLAAMKLMKCTAFGKLKSHQIMDPLFINIQWKMKHFMFWKEFSFQYGNEEAKVADKGQFINAPRGEFHTYKNIGSSFGKLLLIITPPYFEKFFQR